MMGERVTVFHDFPVWLPLTQTWMHNQIRCLPEEEIEGHVICEQTENLDQFPFPRIHAFRKKEETLLDKMVRKVRFNSYHDFMVHQVKEHEARILHSHFADVAWYHRSVVEQASLRQVVSFYGYDVNYLPSSSPEWNARYEELFAGADLFLCEGNHMARSVEALGAPSAKVKVHHLGVMVDTIPFKARVWHGPGPLRILLAATFQEKKGIPYALRAVGMIKKEIPVEVTIIGDAAPEPRSLEEKRKIGSVIKEWGLQEVVHLKGFQPYNLLLEEAYGHHVFMAPSVTALDGDTEGGAPVVLIEMAASGMPVVATDHCDIPSIVVHGKTGLVTDERDPEGLARNLLWLAANVDQWQSLTQAARTHVEEEYNAPVQGRRLARLYREVLAL